MDIVDAEEVNHFDGVSLSSEPTMSRRADINPSTRKKTGRGISRLGSGSMVEDRYCSHNHRQYLGEETEAEEVFVVAAMSGDDNFV